MLLDHPLVKTAVDVVRRDAGEGAEEVIARALEDAGVGARASARPDAAQAEAEHARVLFGALWRQLAAAYPQRFDARVFELSVDANPAAFARYHADAALEPFALSAREAALADSARGWLLTLTGLDELRRPRVVYATTPGSPLAAYAQFERYAGWCLADEPALRDELIVDFEHAIAYRRKGGGELVSLIVHEEIHSAIAAAANPSSDAYFEPLVGWVDEACVSVLEIIATSAATLGRVSARSIRRRAARHPYRQAALCLLRLLGGVETKLAIRRCAALAVENLQVGCDRASAALLNTLAGERRSVREWQRALGG